jgi:RHS repeat-associated protein
MDSMDGDGVALEFNLRYPGQYYDSATGWHYNYFRDYEPGTGRYVQSDPIGLLGGLGTYVYVSSSPLRWTDRLGLSEDSCCEGSSSFRPRSREVIDRVLERIAFPVNFFGSAVVMNNANMDMRRDNTIGNDKYFHCVGSCKASRAAGVCAAHAIGDLREELQDLFGRHHEDRYDDELANATGRGGVGAAVSCEKWCEQYIVSGINQNYLPQ